MDPSTLALINAGSSILGKAGGIGQTEQSRLDETNVFDNSGWSVNFGSGTITQRTDKQGTTGTTMPLGNNSSQWLLIVGAALVAVLVIKMARK